MEGCHTQPHSVSRIPTVGEKAFPELRRILILVMQRQMRVVRSATDEKYLSLGMHREHKFGAAVRAAKFGKIVFRAAFAQRYSDLFVR
jgi:hypothetical protein